jgi:tyrosyl-tRNA synthetase
VRNFPDSTSGRQLDVLKLLTASKLVPSMGAARRLVDQGGVSVNRQRLPAGDRFVFGDEVLIRGEYIIVGKGKRDFAVLRVRGP